jgi:two-component system sensor histidine kinase KdpD
LTALGWNFLFAPPRYSFHIGSFYDKMMLAMYFVVALTVGQLTARLRAERRAEQEREKCSTALYHLTRELAEAADRADIIARATQQARLVFGTEAVVLFVDPGEKAGRPVAGGVSWQNSEADQRAAAWACEHNQLAGRKTQNWAEAEGLYVPLRAGNGPAGVLGIRGGTLGPLSVQQQNLLQSFAQQIALVMDRQRLREAELNTRMLAESERLGRTLLNSISHELRTPIAAITGAVSSLGGSGALTAAQQNLLIEIESAAARLNRVVQSLLSAARLQSGQLRPAMDWCDIPELIRTSLQHLGEGLAGHPVDTQVAPGLPLVKADFVLMEQVLTNLLLNAALHTPFQTPIEIRARLEAGLLRLEVADRGPGLPLDQIDRIFDLFHRAPTAKPGGTGLGLAIVKGLIEAQGGTVHAGNRPGGGAIFSLYLPVTEPPEVLEETL